MTINLATKTNEKSIDSPTIWISYPSLAYASYGYFKLTCLGGVGVPKDSQIDLIGAMYHEYIQFQTFSSI